VLGHYARDQALFPLETAVHKMTGLSAATFGLQDRGLIKAGHFADLVLFDPLTVVDQATFDMPQTQASGIEKVWVNGKLAFDEGRSTGTFAGRVLTRGGHA